MSGETATVKSMKISSHLISLCFLQTQEILMFSYSAAVFLGLTIEEALGLLLLIVSDR